MPIQRLRVRGGAVNEAVGSHDVRAFIAAHRSDPQAWLGFFERHRDRLCLLIDRHLDGRLRRRIEAEDVVQEAMLEAFLRIDDFLDQTGVSVWVWLRFIACQRLLQLRRYHLAAKRRDVRREVQLGSTRDPLSSSGQVLPVSSCLSRETSPVDLVLRVELRERLDLAFVGLTVLEREIVKLRHFDGLTNTEAAEALAIDESAASSRYGRALRKLARLIVSRWAPEDG